MTLLLNILLSNFYIISFISKIRFEVFFGTKTIFFSNEAKYKAIRSKRIA